MNLFSRCSPTSGHDSKTPTSPAMRGLVALARVPETASAPNTPGAKPDAINACITKLSATIHTVVSYQPASRFWPFQWAEMGIFLAAALALCGFTYWWLRRRYA